MAIYHCSVKIIGRSSGRSSVAAAAYRAGQKITNERDGITHDYTRKGGVAHSEIVLPDHAPKEYKDRATLWNAVERAERRGDSQTAREVEVALPVEFNVDENVGVVRDYIQENFVSKGMCADYSIHSSKGNPHANIMLTMRDVSTEGFEKKNRDWNNVQLLEEWRENWAKVCNEKLEEKGLQKIDHRSLEAQGLERIPTIHVGRSFEREIINERIILFNEQYTPQNVSQFMNELSEGYVIARSYINELNQGERELARIEDSIKAISKRTEDLREQYLKLEQAKAEREGMGFFQSKKEINAKIERLEDTYRHAWNYFERSYKVAPDEVHNEIKRLQADYANIVQSRDSASLSLYQGNMRDFEREYKRQYLLAEIRVDGGEIIVRLDKTAAALRKITNDDYREIAQELRQSQRVIIERERERQTRARGFYDFVR